MSFNTGATLRHRSAMLAAAALALTGLTTPLAVQATPARRSIERSPSPDPRMPGARCAACPATPGFAAQGAAQQASGAPPRNQPAVNEVHALRVQGNVWMLVGGGEGTSRFRQATMGCCW